MVGILQVYDPGTWMPTELSSMVTGTLGGIGNVSYIGPDGRTIIRPLACPIIPELSPARLRRPHCWG